MPMIVILEGPDGSGKTTLARRLARDLSLVYHHEGPPPFPEGLTALEHYGNLLDHMRNLTCASGAEIGWVVDRFALGETVYGPVLRGASLLSDDAWRVMRRLYRAAAVRHVLCLPPPEVCLQNWSEKKHDLVKDFFTFKEAYRRWVNLKRGLRVFDYTSDSLTELMKWISKPQPILPRRMVGTPTGKYLIVGERSNGVLDLPFFATDRSSGYLTKCLRDAGFKESELLWANALSKDGRVNKIFPDLLLPDKAFKVIALGGVASKVLNDQGITPHASLPHPQYWKQFHASQRGAYVEMLKETRG